MDRIDLTLAEKSGETRSPPGILERLVALVKQHLPIMKSALSWATSLSPTLLKIKGDIAIRIARVEANRDRSVAKQNAVAAVETERLRQEGETERARIAAETREKELRFSEALVLKALSDLTDSGIELNVEAIPPDPIITFGRNVQFKTTMKSPSGTVEDERADQAPSP